MILLRLVAITVLLGTFNIAHAELNVGKPREVRLVYVIPHGGEYNQAVVDKMKVDIVMAQKFFAEQLDNYGYGYSLFRIERDADGSPLVHIIQEDSDGFYSLQLFNVFDLSRNIYLAVYDNNESIVGGLGGITRDVGGIAVRRGIGGLAVIPTNYIIFTFYHELGHLFLLDHNFRRDTFEEPRDIMGRSGGWDSMNITECYARLLAINPHFNDGIHHDITFVRPFDYDETVEGIEVIIPDTYTVSDEFIDVRVNVTNPNGIYQVLLHSIDNFVECVHGDGSTNATFDFRYEGYRMGLGTVRPKDSKHIILNFTVIDMAGNHYTDGVYSIRQPLEDVNQDDVINILDLVIVATHISNSTYDSLADVNQDGIINVLDLVKVSQALQ